jgi:hypothetical protein
VLATDISSAILRYAADAATRAGLANVLTSELDGEELDGAPAAFDAVISRLGLFSRSGACAGRHVLDARATFHLERTADGEPLLVWRRIGYYSIYQRP